MNRALLLSLIMWVSLSAHGMKKNDQEDLWKRLPLCLRTEMKKFIMSPTELKEVLPILLATPTVISELDWKSPCPIDHAADKKRYAHGLCHYGSCREEAEDGFSLKELGVNSNFPALSCCSRNGKQMASVFRVARSDTHSSCIEYIIIKEQDTDRQVQKIPFSYYPNYITCLEYVGNNDVLLISSSTGDLIFLCAHTGKILKVFECQRDDFTEILTTTSAQCDEHRSSGEFFLSKHTHYYNNIEAVTTVFKWEQNPITDDLLEALKNCDSRDSCAPLSEWCTDIQQAVSRSSIFEHPELIHLLARRE